jgi:hypothetical protein
VFGGSLRSDVICSACGHTSTTLDHFTNLSLDIPPPAAILPAPIIPRAHHHSVNGKAGAAAAKAAKGLVGAARVSHMRRLQREQAHAEGSGAEPTPERSSDAGGTGAPGWSEGATVAGEDSEEAAQDTLSSPPRRPQAQDDAHPAAAARGAAGLQDAAAAATNVVGTQGPVAAAAGAAAAAPSHPALTGYLRWPGASLVGSLRRFVRAEQLGSGEQWRCEGCDARRDAVKQLSLLRLPPVLVLHAKRFEHPGGMRAAAKKLDTFVAFPLEGLRMAPFLSSTVLRARHHLAQQAQQAPRAQQRAQGGSAAAAEALLGHPAAPGTVRRTRSQGGGAARLAATLSGGRAACSAGTNNADAAGPAGAAAHCSTADGPEQEDPAAAGEFLYDLFAVVCHRGTFQGGHYVCYVRCADGAWYLCDDAYVARVDAEAVRNCQAYMLFYGQRGLLPFHSGGA